MAPTPLATLWGDSPFCMLAFITYLPTQISVAAVIIGPTQQQVRQDRTASPCGEKGAERQAGRIRMLSDLHQSDARGEIAAVVATMNHYYCAFVYM